MINSKNYPLVKQADNKKKINLSGYPAYPVSEDIYNQETEKTEIDPEQPDKLKGDITNDELDIPGSELDDSQEEIGSEDEENNSYSLSDNDRD